MCCIKLVLFLQFAMAKDSAPRGMAMVKVVARCRAILVILMGM
jgi:hypothetical protein